MTAFLIHPVNKSKFASEFDWQLHANYLHWKLYRNAENANLRFFEETSMVLFKHDVSGD